MSEVNDKSLKDRIIEAVTGSAVWRSIFRHGFADTDRNKALSVSSNWMLHVHPVKVKPHATRYSYLWCMGGITFFLFLVLTVTGILLMFYYHPSPAEAYKDMKYLSSDISFGKLLRNMHRWAAHLMVLTVMLHMIRVFLTGSYKPPREFNWVVGVVLLLVTFLLSFTGYLLPWDQLAFWAITVGTNMGKNTPLLGSDGPFSVVTKYNDVSFVLLGGTEVGAATLLRFYVLHIVVLPVVGIIGMGIHFWRIRKDGGISGPL